MNTPRFLRTLIVHGLLGVVLSTAGARAISPEELAALRAKAESGNGIAQYNLGLLHATVNDPVADPVEAYVWFNLAADNGATGRALVLLSSQLTPEQISEGKRRLELRRAELAAKKAKPSSPVSAVVSVAPPIAPAPASPIGAAAPSQTPIGPTSSNENDLATLQAELKKMGAELADAWRENDQLKSSLARAAASTPASTEGEQWKRERDQLQATLAATNEELTKLRAASANFEGERNALQQKIATASEQGAKAGGLSAELAAANEKLRTAESRLAQAGTSANELANAKQTLATLSDQVQRLTAENQRLGNLAAQVTSSAESKSVAEKELTSLRSELTTTQSQLAQLRAESTANSSLQKQLEETQMKLEAAMRSYDLQQKDVDKLQKALANIDGERERLAKEVSDLKATPKSDPALERRVTQLTADLEAAQRANSQNGRLQQQLAETQTKLEAAESKLSSAAQDRDRLTQQLVSAQAAAAAPSAEATRLTQELKETRERLGLAEQSLAKVRDENQRSAHDAAGKAQAQVAQLSAELGDARQRVAASDEMLAKVNQERDNLRRQLSSASAAGSSSAELGALQLRLKAAEQLAATESKTIGPAENVATSSTDASAELRRELAETQSKLSASLRTYQLQQDEVDRLQKALANIDAERAELAERIQNSTSQTNQALAQAAVNQEAASQLAGVREQLRQMQNQLASLAGENAQLKNRLALSGPAPSSLLAAPTRPGGATVQSAPARSAPTAPTPAPTTRTHTVADGDTLTRIARRYYGNAEKWPQILEANRAVIKDVNNLTVGTSLKIP